MSFRTVFRILLVATLVGAIAGALAAIFPGTISDDWRTVTEWNGNGSVYERFESFTFPTHIVARVALIALVVLIVLFCISIYVGLFLFWRFARLGNVVLTILFLLVAPWAGLVILLPLEAALYEFTMLCEGAVIALSYSPPIKHYFEPNVASPGAGIASH